MRHVLFAAIAAIAAVPAAAHDFWIGAGDFSHADAPATVALSLRVGHGKEQTPWGADPERIVRASVVVDGAVRDALVAARERREGKQANFTLADLHGGTNILRLDTDEAFIELPAEQFDAYVAEEGLALIAAHRTSASSREAPGREVYARNAKALFQVGDAATDVSKRLGQRLELVPMTNPYALDEGAVFPVAVYYKGEPAAGVSVSAESLSLAVIPEQTAVSDKQGVVRFSIPKRGAWKIHAVWGEPVDDDNADYRTVFSSLTFGF